jgi:hypothetical protein
VSASTVALAALGAMLAAIVAGGPVLMFLIERWLPWGICRRLRRGQKSITIRTRYAGGTWNPAKPLGRGNSTPNEPGLATYTLTNDGLVRLELVRADGRHEQLVGPPVQPPEGHARSRRIGAIPTLVYLGCAGSGFALAYWLTDSRTPSYRVQIGILAALGSWVIAWLGLTVTFAVRWSRLHSGRGPAVRDDP